MLSNRAATVSQSASVVPTEIPTLGVLRVTASMNYYIRNINTKSPFALFQITWGFGVLGFWGFGG